jgi:hypothetical protein
MTYCVLDQLSRSMGTLEGVGTYVTESHSIILLAQNLTVNA